MKCFFRFSLLSLLVAVIVAGVFLWLNMTPRGPWFEHGYGWPWLYRYWLDFGITDPTTTDEVTHDFSNTKALLLDALIAVLATLLAGASTEWLVRLSRRKPPDAAT